MNRAKRLLIALVLAAAGTAPLLAGPGALPAEFEQRIEDTKSSIMANPEVALEKARTASDIANALPQDRADIAIATSKWLESEALNRLNRPEEAEPINAHALSLVEKSLPESKLHADLLKSSAAIQARIGNVQQAMPKLYQAYAIYEKLGDTRSQSIILQNLGSVYHEARDYSRAMKYYEQARTVHKNDAALSLALHNNRGNVLKEMGNFGEAEKEYRTAMQKAVEMESPFLEMQILSNIAATQFLAGNLDQASRTVEQGIRGSRGPAEEWRKHFYGTRAQIALSRNNLTKAKGDIEDTFAGMNLKNTTVPFRDLHETAYKIYAQLGENAKALSHLEAFKRLDDDGRELAASTNSALMSAQFDAANQQLRISKLEAQKVQRELDLARSETRLKGITQLAVVGGLSAVAIIIAMLFAFASARRRRREVSAANVQLTHAANHDLLTGLANRFQFRRLLDETIMEAAEVGRRNALFLIDLDRFKYVNDTLGHQAGDDILCHTANMLSDIAGKNGYAARLGGDEFAIIIPDAPNDEDLLKMGDEIISKLSKPQIIAGMSVNVGATAGVAVGSVDGATGKDLTRAADLALYDGKRQGRGRTVRFDPQMEKEANERSLLEKDLRSALQNGELSLAYQSIVDAHSERIVGHEALLRWQHPERGEVSPKIFVPIAEEAGLINRIGDWVLHTACNKAAHWPDHVKLAVNLSSMQVEGRGLTTSLISALASSGLSADRLELEVTESVFLREESQTDETLKRIRSIGINLVLDDFGTGFSSLGYLRRASFSAIKIDRSFVKSATTGSQDSLAIIRAIVSMARDLNMKTTAEGIENRQEVEKMRDLGCTQLQGYLFSMPSSEPSRDTSDSWFADRDDNPGMADLQNAAKKRLAG